MRWTHVCSVGWIRARALRGGLLHPTYAYVTLRHHNLIQGTKSYSILLTLCWRSSMQNKISLLKENWQVVITNYGSPQKQLTPPSVIQHKISETNRGLELKRFGPAADVIWNINFTQARRGLRLRPTKYDITPDLTLLWGNFPMFYFRSLVRTSSGATSPDDLSCLSCRYPLRGAMRS